MRRTTDTERSALLRCPLFARIAPNDVFALTECLGAAERRYERGEALWLTGDAVSACAVVLSGGVRAESLLPSGERSLTAVHGPGALVGDVLMATRDKKSPVDGIAAQNTAALFLPYRAMMASCAHACERHALLRENLLAEIAEKYWRLRRRAEYLARHSLRGKHVLARHAPGGSCRLSRREPERPLPRAFAAARRGLDRLLPRQCAAHQYRRARKERRGGESERRKMNETENQKENFRQRCAVLQDENASEGFTVPMEETATKKRGNKKTRIALVIALSLVLLAVIALGGVSVYYRSAFLPGTIINGYDCSGVSEAGAAEFLLGTAKSHTAQLRDAQGDAVVALPLESFVDTDSFTAALEEYFDAQHAEAGLFGWMTKCERSLETGVYTVSDTAAASELLSRVLYDETPRQAPVDARIVLGEDGYTVDPGSKGNLVNLANCVSAIAEQLPAVRDLREESPVIEAKNAVIRQNVTVESPELLAQRAAIDAYLATEVTLDFQDGNTYTLTPQDIWRMSDVTLSDAEGQTVCAPVPEKVKALSDALADEYALDGVYAKFHNAEKTRPYIYYRVGDTGWILDRDALASDIAAALETETDATITPSYDTSWYWKQEYWFYNFTDTFVEISLDNQYMWYYVDGKLLVETPVVTGNIAAGDDTRRGCFRIASMTTDTYLVGPTWNDHVEYWMPFDDQIGLHDSSWRTEYGGDIYLTDGSHGCVNTPLDAIATIYNNITVGTLVVVY